MCNVTLAQPKLGVTQKLKFVTPSVNNHLSSSEKIVFQNAQLPYSDTKINVFLVQLVLLELGATRLRELVTLSVNNLSSSTRKTVSKHVQNLFTDIRTNVYHALVAQDPKKPGVMLEPELVTQSVKHLNSSTRKIVFLSAHPSW